MGVFGHSHGYCVCDVHKAVIPVCFHHGASQISCVHYFAQGTTAREIKARWAHRIDFSIVLEDEFVVQHWGHVVEVAVTPNSQSGHTTTLRSSKALLSLEDLLVDEDGPMQRAAPNPVPSDWEQHVHELWHAPLAALPDGLKVHDSTAKVLEKPPDPNANWHWSSCVVYVDGSSSKGQQAWSLVATKQGRSSRSFRTSAAGC